MIAFLYLFPATQNKTKIGLNFDPIYAKSLDLNWKDVYLSALVELQPQHISIPALWSEVESIKGIYNYTDIDWMLSEANKRDIKTTLIIGQKGRRGVACRIPKWVEGNQEASLLRYVKNTVERYTEHPSLEMIQVEIDPFVPFTEECPQYHERVKNIVLAIKEINSQQLIIVNDNAETGNIKSAVNQSDLLGLSIFRSRKGTDGQVFTYNWLSINIYKLKLKWNKVQLENTLISALQAEPWFTTIGMLHTPIQEQEKLMNIEILDKHLIIAQQLVNSSVYLDGVEWWYFMRVNNGVDVYWNKIKELVTNN